MTTRAITSVRGDYLRLPGWRTRETAADFTHVFSGATENIVVGRPLIPTRSCEHNAIPNYHLRSRIRLSFFLFLFFALFLVLRAPIALALKSSRE